MARHDFDPAVVQTDGRPATSATLFEPSAEKPWRGNVPGAAIGSAITVLVYGNDAVGGGPRLHVHPYDETFIVIEGRAQFTVGDAVLEASAGEMVFEPAGVPHKFVNLGPGRLRTLDVHHSPNWIQTDLE